eukprot:6213783-Pleurochrysis_carterae.AAC.3
MSACPDGAVPSDAVLGVQIPGPIFRQARSPAQAWLWKKYRHKIRASKCWLQKQSNTEAKEANSRECRERGRKTRHEDTRRRGGAGGRGRARAVSASSIEEEIMKDIGVPQQTWGDGSCWLWAVAGALHKLEGNEGPTENDINLKKE